MNNSLAKYNEGATHPFWSDDHNKTGLLIGCTAVLLSMLLFPLSDKVFTVFANLIEISLLSLYICEAYYYIAEKYMLNNARISDIQYRLANNKKVYSPLKEAFCSTFSILTFLMIGIFFLAGSQTGMFFAITAIIVRYLNDEQNAMKYKEMVYEKMIKNVATVLVPQKTEILNVVH